MGFKLHPTGAMVEASLANGEFTVYLGEHSVTFELPVKTLCFERQCNFHRNENVRAVLKNDEYVLVLRFDGTGMVMTKDTRVLISNFTYCSPIIGYSLPEREIGVCNVDGIQVWLNLAMYFEDTHVLYAPDYPLTLTFTESQNTEVLKMFKSVDWQAVRMLAADVNTKRIYVTQRGSNELFELEGELLINDGFVVY